MNIPIEEQETIVNFRRNDTEAEIYTSDSTVLTKLRTLARKNPKTWVSVEKIRDSKDHDIVAERFHCPKKLISFRSTITVRKYTEEQKRELAERMKRIREKGGAE